MVVVYWIRRKDHTNPTVDGYVGVSRDLDRRVQEHQREKWFYRDECTVDVLKQFDTEKDAYVYEEFLRPIPNIGWNLNKGGIKPPINTRLGIPMSHWSDEDKYNHSVRMKDCYATGKIKHWSNSYTKEEVSLKISIGDPGKSKRGKPSANRTSIKEITQNIIFDSQSEAAKELNIRQSDIANCLSGRQQSTKGYKFVYVNRDGLAVRGNE